MTEVFIIAATTNQEGLTRKVKCCLFNQHNWEEAVRECTEKELSFTAIRCRAEDEMLIPESWYSRGPKPYPTSELENNLEKAAERRWQQRFEFTFTTEYLKARLHGDL